MVLRFDEKGKFFTEIISKTEIPVTIQTTTNLVRGLMFVKEGQRLSDEINRAGHFLAVVDATIFDNTGEKRYMCEFLAIHRDHIIWLMPDNEDSENKNHKVEGII